MMRPAGFPGSLGRLQQRRIQNVVYLILRLHQFPKRPSDEPFRIESVVSPDRPLLANLQDYGLDASFDMKASGLLSELAL